MNDRMRYGPPPRRTAGAAASWLVGLFVAVLLVRAMVNGTLSFVVGAAGVLLLVAWAVVWWRYRRRGVYVDVERIWVCRVLRTDSVPLGDVSVVDTMPAKPDGVRRLVLHLEDGRHVATPLRGYARGHDDPAGPLGVLPSAGFTSVLTDLQRRVMAAA
ncbi:MAG TPA: hypothetical protein VH969_29515 [Actinophytocola sp.]|jgi:hypothetical protein|uniref:hypothetical protein n=1 Tax=Actinophytocola sp. TaxID=1872138 RepID=UPI002F921BC5